MCLNEINTRKSLVKGERFIRSVFFSATVLTAARLERLRFSKTFHYGFSFSIVSVRRRIQCATNTCKEMDNRLGTRWYQTLYTSLSIPTQTLLLVEWIDRSRKVGVPDGKRPIPHIAPPHSLLTAIRSDQIHQKSDHQHARQNRNQRHGIPDVDPLPLLGPLDSSHSPIHVIYPSCTHTAATSTH